MTKQKDLIDKVFAGYDIEVDGEYINIYKKTKIACSRIDKQGVRFEKDLTMWELMKRRGF